MMSERFSSKCNDFATSSLTTRIRFEMQREKTLLLCIPLMSTAKKTRAEVSKPCSRSSLLEKQTNCCYLNHSENPNCPSWLMARASDNYNYIIIIRTHSVKHMLELSVIYTQSSMNVFFLLWIRSINYHNNKYNLSTNKHFLASFNLMYLT